MLIDRGDFVVVVLVMLEPAMTKRVKATNAQQLQGKVTFRTSCPRSKRFKNGINTLAA